MLITEWTKVIPIIKCSSAVFVDNFRNIPTNWTTQVSVCKGILRNNPTSGWPHFWEIKFPEFSLRFPGYFQTFPWVTRERNVCWNTILLTFMLHILHFPQVFHVFIHKNSNFPDNFSNSLIFQGFPCFPGFGHTKNATSRFPRGWKKCKFYF